MRTNEHDASTPVEEDHPSVDDSTKDLKENAVDPAPDGERQVSDVDDPDENSGTDFAVPAKEQPEDPIEDVVDKGNGEEDHLPWKGKDEDDVPLPE